MSESSVTQYLLRLGDTSLILSQRLSDWIGHAPAVEEDLGLANIALDLLGQARLLLSYAGEATSQSEDDLAYLRGASQFYNLTLAEQPNGDFAHTVARLYLTDAWRLATYTQLRQSNDKRLADIATKTLKEIRYHIRYSRNWLTRLGDGTEESARRMQKAVDDLWCFTRELITADALDEEMHTAGIGVDIVKIRDAWNQEVDQTFAQAVLTRPETTPFKWFGKQGDHSEHLGHLLAEMQSLARANPGAKW